MDQLSNQTKPSKLTIYLIIAIVVLLGVVVLLFFKSPKIIEKEAVIDELTIDKAILARDYNELALEFDSLQTNNKEMNEHLSRERERVIQLLEELKTMKSANAAQISQYKKELLSLRNVMRNFVVQIDSLNARNKELSQENIEVKKQYSSIKDSYSELSKEKESLVQKVDIASKLESFGLKVVGLNNRGKEINKANRTVKIKVLFTLLKNVTAAVGEKNIYVRIARPDGELLFHSESDLFAFEGSEINFSASRTVEYGGENMEVNLVYNVTEGELMAGTYTVDLFADGKQIGRSTFILK